MHYAIPVENIRCGGCANRIRGRLLEKGLALNVEVDIGQGQVHMDGNPEWRDRGSAALAGMGYPEVGSLEDMKAAAAKAGAFLSCAIGRIDHTGTTGK